jgi:hypothetical protein
MQKCGMDELTRATGLYLILTAVSSASSLIDEYAYERDARLWLDVEDDRVLCPDEPEILIQRYIAALIYFSFNGPEWSNCDAELPGDPSLQPCVGDGKRWLDASHECDWFGVTCDSTIEDQYNPSPITNINLTANNLAGFMPIEMFELTELTGLSMDHNKNIYGQIPEEISWLEKLTYINLDDNYLQGPIPSEIYGMTALRAIDLNANRLTGTISSDIGNLENLMVLQLEDNYFQGTIPQAALAKLDKLRKSFAARFSLWDCYDHSFGSLTHIRPSCRFLYSPRHPPQQLLHLGIISRRSLLGNRRPKSR